MLPLMHLAGSGSRPVLTITVSTNQTNFNLKTAIEALYGTVSVASDIVCTINAGVQISGGGTAPAFRTGGFPSGSSIIIVNYGAIRGRGGNGGDGGNGSGSYNGTSASNGKDAIELDDDASIDNTTTGNIFGGGGGGGGGGGASYEGGHGGGGGGGGQGDPGGSKGSGGSPGGNNGTDGSASSKGSGGSGDSGTSTKGGKGGGGGSWGSNGSGGNDASVIPPAEVQGGTLGNGGARGLAGRAVRKNGKTLTWIAGNNATQVKGAVS